MITRENYEIYFIDYLDKNLSDKQLAELNAFLLKNPDLAEELDFLPEIKLDSPVKSLDTTRLKKDISKLSLNEENADELLVSLIENDYPDSKKEALIEWVENNQSISKNFDLYKKPKLNATEIEYNKKSLLFRLPNFELESVNNENAQMFAIASAENDLSTQSSLKWSSFLKEKSEEEIKELDFEKIKLIPDYSISFGDKQVLLRSKRRYLTMSVTAISTIAAGLVLYFGVNQYVSNQDPLSPKVVAHIESIENSSIEVDKTTEKVNSKLAATIEQNLKSQDLIVRPEKKSVEPRVYNDIKKVEPIEYAFLNIQSDEFADIHGEKVVPEMMSVVYEEEVPKESENPNSKKASLPIRLYRQSGLKKVAEWGIAQLNKNPDRFNFKTEYNDKNEMVYFAIQTPIFAIERKRK